MIIQMASPAFADGGVIPKKYTCDGENVSPPLTWSGTPPETKSLALTCSDPDSPSGEWDHWVVYNLPGDLQGLPEAVKGAGTDGRCSWERPGYRGPCPPRGAPHRYFFKLYALDAVLNLKPGLSRLELEKTLRGHILAVGQIMGRYGR